MLLAHVRRVLALRRVHAPPPVHILEPFLLSVAHDGANTRIQEFVKGIDFENYTFTFYNDLSIETGVLNFSKEIEADLIGISTHGRQGLSHFINGSISEDLVNHAKRPVITFKI
jgi:hypothetical protein